MASSAPVRGCGAVAVPRIKKKTVCASAALRCSSTESLLSTSALVSGTPLGWRGAGTRRAGGAPALAPREPLAVLNPRTTGARRRARVGFAARLGLEIRTFLAPAPPPTAHRILRRAQLPQVEPVVPFRSQRPIPERTIFHYAAAWRESLH